MKRHLDLQPLSDDHHRALVLARKLRRESAGLDATGLETLRLEVRRVFEGDLGPHFAVEERLLLPALRAHGALDIAERIASDHARLRELVFGDWSEGTPTRLGAKLFEHVRYEERVAFPEAEARLSEAELAAVREAALHQKDRG